MSATTTAVLTVVFCLGSLALLSALFVGSIVAVVKLVRFLLPCRGVPPAAPARARQSAFDPGELVVRRYRRLVDLDVDPVTAAGAALSELDLSAFRDLVERDCPPEVALRILEPDDAAPAASPR